MSFPANARFYQSSTFATEGDEGFVTSTDGRVWSFSLVTGALLDADGLTLPAFSVGATTTAFSTRRLAVEAFVLPNQGYFIVGTGNPAQLECLGFLPVIGGINAQPVVVDQSGRFGFVASTDGTLNAFDVVDMALEDPDGLVLPGQPNGIARSGERLAIVDRAGAQIHVVDASVPAHLELIGSIPIPGAPAFANNEIVFAHDGRTGFVSTRDQVLHSFDIFDLCVLDPDGLAYGSFLSFATNTAISGRTVACLWGAGIALVDVSDPTDLRLRADVAFPPQGAVQGSATLAFSQDGRRVAAPLILPDYELRSFELRAGQQVGGPVPVAAQPNQLTTLKGTDRVAALCTDTIWLVDGLFEP